MSHCVATSRPRCDEADVIVALAKKAGATGAPADRRRVGRGSDRPGAGAIGQSAKEIQEGFARKYGRAPQAWEAKASSGVRMER